MFDKVHEQKYNNFYLKIYLMKKEYNIFELIEQIQNSQNNIINIYIKENADIGMNAFEGNYCWKVFI